jgi:hypothetical protein
MKRWVALGILILACHAGEARDENLSLEDVSAPTAIA